MPFKSQKQRSWMYANKPKMAKKWQAETPAGASLPVKKAKTGTVKVKLPGGY